MRALTPMTIGSRRRRGPPGKVLLLLMCAAGCLASEEPSRAKQFTLSNGLKVVLYEKHDIPIVNITAGVNLGTKDEPENGNGLVHLLEHCLLFRGTASRNGIPASREIRKNGAYFNAHTGPDVATFEISLPADRAEFGLINQKEILFDFSLSSEELEKEKDIVLEELRLLQDDPQQRAMTIVYEHLFAGHPYSKPISGQADVIAAATVDRLESFYRAYVVPENCSLAIVGDFDIEWMENKVRDVYGPIPRAAIPLKTPEFSIAPLLRKSVQIRETMDVKETYLVLGFVGPDTNHPDQYAVDLLAEALGRGVNPMLASALRKRADLVQSIDISYFAQKYGGIFMIFFTLDAGDLPAVVGEAVQFLNRARDINYSEDDYIGDEKFRAFDFLQGAKNRIRLNSRKAAESGLRFAGSLARHLLLYERKDDSAPFLDRIGKIKSSDLREAAAKYFSKGECVIVSILPRNAV